MNKPCNQNATVEIYDAQSGKVKHLPLICKTDEEWRALLTPEQYEVMRLKGTERLGSGACPVPAKGKSGIYQCVGCGTDLFKYESKFESGTGWPSFWEPISNLNVRLVPDDSYRMHRTEVLCARCGAHLGHVFDDGPEPTGKRYCINPVALRLAKRRQKTETATFAAGCFWGVESAYRSLLGKGVLSGWFPQLPVLARRGAAESAKPEPLLHLSSGAPIGVASIAQTQPRSPVKPQDRST